MKIALLVLAGLLAGCAAGPARVVLETQPPGGTVGVAGTDIVVTHGTEVELPAGTHGFTARADGFRAATVSADIVASAAPVVVTVPLGMGYAEVAIRATPAQASIAIGGEVLATGSLDTELDAGEHALLISHPGYQAHTETLAVTPGQEITRDIVLLATEAPPPEAAPAPPPPPAPAPTHGSVELVPSPSNAVLSLGQRSLGEGAQRIDALAPGGHTVSGVAPLDAVRRLVGEARFELEAGALLRVPITLERSERLFEGAWLPAADAQARELARYRGARVSEPFALIVEEALRPRLCGLDALAPALMQILRVGDRLVSPSAGAPAAIWKRHAQTTHEFDAAVAAWCAGESTPYEWADDTARRVRVPVQTEDPLASLAFGLHQARSAHPLLDLGAAQLPAAGIEIQRVRGDGVLTLIAQGGAGFDPVSQSAWSSGTLVLARFPAGDGPHALRWQTPPQRLLIISDTRAPVVEYDGQAVLLRGEKRLINLLDQVSVKRMTRLSHGPDFEGWQRSAIDTSGPLGFQLDLASDEIGPHERAGDYRRLWVLEYTQGGQTTQRQVELRYRVTDDVKEVESSEFLRRGQGT